MQENINILYLGTADLVDRYEDVFEANGLHVVQLDRSGMESEGLIRLIRHYIAEKDIRAVIGFGRMLTELRPGLNIPIVELKHTYYSYVSAYRSALAMDSRIGMILWKSTEEIGLSQFLKDYRDKLEIIEEDDYIKNDIHVRNALWENGLGRLKAMGYRICLGSAMMAEFAKKFGIIVVPIGLDMESVLYAISDLKAQIHLYYDQRVGYEQMHTMLDRINEGVIAVNLRGDILDINEKARKICGLKAAEPGDAGGMKQGDALGNLESLMPDPQIRRLLQDKIKLENYILMLNHANVIVNSIATYYKETGENGYILTFQEISNLHNLVHDIQSKILKKNLYAKHTFADILGGSAAVTQALRQAKRFAAASSTVLIEGDSGTGKELFAQSIHNASPRKDMPFVAINCAALPENLLESELFGYVRGAFTGARADGKPGLFEMANHGTIFLDEIGEISPQVQSRLLRVLQEWEVSRLGDDKVIRVDVRVLVATNRNLYQEMQAGRFREDLYYRLCVLELWLPALRDRKGDIPILLEHFLAAHGRPGIRFTPGATDALFRYDWPGNIRELLNFTDRLCVMADEDLIGRDMVRQLLARRGNFPECQGWDTSRGGEAPESGKYPVEQTGKPTEGYVENPAGELAEGQAETPVGKPAEGHAGNLAEKHMAGRCGRYSEAEIQECLLRHRGSRRDTAAELGVSTVTLWRWMKAFREDLK
jgi:transcriptional regulator with PAS, ATPase and Fis domain